MGVMADRRYHTGRHMPTNSDRPNRLSHMTSPPAISDQTDVTIALYKSVIGPISQSYYLRVFAHFDAKGKTGPLWHWSAFFSTLNWLVFRKMWGMAAWFSGLALFFTLAVFGIGKLVFSFSETTEWLLTGVSLLLAFVLPGLFANAAYYRFCERTINSVLETGVGVAGACDILAQRASSRQRLLGLATLNLVVLAMLVTLLTWLTGGHQTGEKRSLTTPLAPGLHSAAGAIKPAAPFLAAAPEAKLEPAVAAQKPAPAPASSPAPAPPTDAPAPGPGTVRPPVAPQYFVQVGAYANLQNARITMTQLEAMGLDAGAAPVVVSDGRLTRIRVGPFQTRAEARKAAVQIKAQGLPALFVKL